MLISISNYITPPFFILLKISFNILCFIVIIRIKKVVKKMKDYILSIDQGTASTRVIIFDKKGHPVAKAQKEFKQQYPKPGWVEQDGNEIWLTTLAMLSEIFIISNINPNQIDSIGITNQRETTIIWDKKTGIPIYNAIVWQSRQTKDICDQLIADGYSSFFKEKTGLPIDAYFSATKVKWLLENVPRALEKAQNNELLFGTIDSWLVWKLSGGKVHVTDQSNASRTMMYNIHDLKWDQEILDLLNIPSSILPEVQSSSQIYTKTDPRHFFDLEVPIASIIGDQQAALFGQSCLEEGMIKNTYGTGCFLLMNTGSKPIKSSNRLITTIAWDIDGVTTYALEGSIFVAGSAIAWLKDNLQILNKSSDTERYAKRAGDNKGVYFVPAFVGLGSPYWDQDVRGAIFGLTRGTGKEEITRATLEAIAYQTKDIIDIMLEEAKIPLKRMRVDGGCSTNEFLMQFQADILQSELDVPKSSEITALGAALLAGLATGYYESLDELKEQWQANKTYKAQISQEEQAKLYSGWQKAVKAAMMFK